MGGRLLGRVWRKPVTDYQEAITRHVVIVSFFDGDPYPQTIETPPGIWQTKTLRPCATIALVPLPNGVEARECHVLWDDFRGPHSLLTSRIPMATIPPEQMTYGTCPECGVETDLWEGFACSKPTVARTTKIG